ncbi:unnamed protein product [Sphacelaria rigidula]
MTIASHHLDDDQYGWFEEQEGGNDRRHEAFSTLSIASAQREHWASMSANKCMNGETMVQLNLATRCFLNGASSVAWTWGVGGHRLIRGRQGARHVEYQIVASLNGNSWSVWRRFSKISGFAKAARQSGAWSTAAQEAWVEVERAVIMHHLDAEFLRHVCVLLHDFLRHYLFACWDLDSLVGFVSPSGQR